MIRSHMGDCPCAHRSGEKLQPVIAVPSQYERYFRNNASESFSSRPEGPLSGTDGRSDVVDHTLVSFAASFASSQRYTTSTPATDLTTEVDWSAAPLWSVSEDPAEQDLDQPTSEEVLLDMTQQSRIPLSELWPEYRDKTPTSDLTAEENGWSKFCGPFLAFWHLVEVTEACARGLDAQFARGRNKRRRKRKYEDLTEMLDGDAWDDTLEDDRDEYEGLVLVESQWRALLAYLSEEYRILGRKRIE